VQAAASEFFQIDRYGLLELLEFLELLVLFELLEDE
jgi:hypothetical protein